MWDEIRCLCGARLMDVANEERKLTLRTKCRNCKRIVQFTIKTKEVTMRVVEDLSPKERSRNKKFRTSFYVVQ